jgi:hypothetical protein
MVEDDPKCRTEFHEWFQRKGDQEVSIVPTILQLYDDEEMFSN